MRMKSCGEEDEERSEEVLEVHFVGAEVGTDKERRGRDGGAEGENAASVRQFAR